MKKPEINKLDKLWRTVGKDGAVCAVCATLPEEERSKRPYQLHPHHIEGRKCIRLRWDYMNRIWLCANHHTMRTQSAHQSPLWFMEWLKKNAGKQYMYVKLKRIESGKYFDFDRVKAYLEKGKICGLRPDYPFAR